jgi:ATP-binding cassette, subfamily B, bacterial
MTTARSSTLTLCRRLLRRARSYWPHIGGLFLIGLLSSPLALLTPLPLKLAVDSVLGTQPLPGFLEALLPAAATRSHALALAAGLVVAIGLLVHVQALASWLLQTYTGEKLVLEFRSQLFRHVQRLSLAYHDTQGTTDSLYRIQYDAPSQWFLIKGVIPLITSGFTVAGMIYVTARIDGQLALVALTLAFRNRLLLFE